MGVEVIYLQSSDLVPLIVTSNGFILLALSTVTLVFHRRALHQAHAVILADKAKYDQAWADIMANNTQRDQVELLANQVKLIQNLSPTLSSHPGMVRQFNRCRESSVSLRSFNIFRSNEKSALIRFSRSLQRATPSPRNLSAADGNAQRWQQLLDCGIPSTLDVEQPVDSLDQLYYQAVALNPLLVDKVKCWALASGGSFCLKQQGISGPRKEEEALSDTVPGAQCSCTVVEDFSAKSNDEVLSVVIQKGGESEEPAIFLNKKLPDGYVLWEQAKGRGLQSEELIKWGSIKSVQRALEKSTRSYNKVSFIIIPSFKETEFK